MFLTPLEVTAGVGVLASGLAFTAAILTLQQKAFSDWRTLQQKDRSDRDALEQRTRSDQHAAWWVRAQWAIDKSLSTDRRTREIGTEAMRVLAVDATATRADLDVLDAAIVRALDLPLT